MPKSVPDCAVQRLAAWSLGGALPSGGSDAVQVHLRDLFHKYTQPPGHEVTRMAGRPMPSRMDAPLRLFSLLKSGVSALSIATLRRAAATVPARSLGYHGAVFHSQR